MKNNYQTLFITSLILMTISCKNQSTDGPLPFLGNTIVENDKTTYHTIPDWTFIDQDSATITNKDLKNVVYVADFFFRSCPSICPKVMKEMKSIYSAFEDNPNVKLVSFTIDPVRDTPSKLKNYASNLNVNTNRWIFVHSDPELIYALANQYFVPAFVDADSPGGFDHSGKIILVDKEGHVRSFSEGTDASTTPKLIDDIKKLLKEYEAQ